MLSQFQVFSQNTFSGLYTNEKEEFVCFNNDTISYRLYNNDGLIIFNIGKCNLDTDKKKYYLLDSKLILNQTSILTIQRRNDNRMSITILDRDSIPMQYVRVSITKRGDKKPILIVLSDGNGYFDLFNKESKESLSLIDEDVSININSLLFETEKTLKLKRGYNYIIHSTIPVKYPFAVFKGEREIVINKLDNDIIEVKIGDNLKSILNKKIGNCFCSDSLFEE